eukprot:scaffold69486_cov57-Attheya_sp.AAC.1
MEILSIISFLIRPTTMNLPPTFTHGLLLGFLAIKFVLLLILESYCANEVRVLLGRKGGKSLYLAAIWANFRNDVLIGAPMYHVAITYICTQGPLTRAEQARSVLGILVVEGLLFFSIHRAFHKVRGLWWMHRFHHKFNDVVLPSSANAVSIAEFVFAYMIPILIGATIMNADIYSTLCATYIIQISNLFIHTPFLEGHWPSSKQNKSFAAWVFVGTSDHLHHHRHMTAHYSAPVFHFDRILDGSKNESGKQK